MLRPVLLHPESRGHLSLASPGPQRQTDEEILAYIRTTALTAHHPMGTCRMGADDMAVVDSKLRVHGVEKLRVIDASVMPDLVCGNINACVLMIAERGRILCGGARVLFDHVLWSAAEVCKRVMR